MTGRIIKLKEKLSSSNNFTDWFLLEQIKMESDKKHPNLTPAKKSAQLLADIVSQMPIDIDDIQTIPGTIDNVFSTSYNLFKDGLDQFEGYCTYSDIYDEVKGKFSDSDIEETKNYWVNADFERRASKLFDSVEKKQMEEMVYFVEPVTGHAIYNAEKVLEKGYNGIEKLVNLKIKTCSDTEKKDFYEAILMTLEAGRSLARRYRELALRKARMVKDDGRRQELTGMAAALENVPANPADSFYEALISFWLTYQLMHLEQTPNPYAFSIGLVDRFLYPYYQTDIESGRMTNEQAKEWIQEFWLKFNVGQKVWAVSQNAGIGGIGCDGKDVTSGLTYLVLDAVAELSIPLPTLTCKIHKDTPKEFYNKTIQLASLGKGNPTVINDDIVVKSKMDTGVSFADAANSGIAGCQELVVCGAENARTTSLWFSLPKCLELTLNSGYSALTGDKMGENLGPVESFTDYQSLYDACWRQIEYFVDKAVDCSNRVDALLAETKPVPFLSAIMNDCIEKGVDFRKDGARYNFSGFLCHGVANMADSLAVIKKLVFEDKTISLKELNEALKANWEGYETLRQNALDVVKYGNDEMYVDTIAAEIVERISNMVRVRKNAVGGAYRVGFSTPSTHVLYGKKCAATADGRKDRDNFAYGIGPMENAPQKGPTAVINSVCKFDHASAHHGLGFSLTFPQSFVKGENGIENFAALVKTYLDKGGRFVHFNVQDINTLIDAMEHPENHKNLIVRVHGMSAYFVNLDRVIQMDIINRMKKGI